MSPQESVGTVGFVGLGVMGSAMSANVAAAGWPVVGFDIDPDRVAHFAEHTGGPSGGGALGSAAEVAEAADVVMLSLPSIEALDQVSQAIATVGDGSGVVIEMGTLPLAAKERAQAVLAEAGATLLDAPVSGTGLQAADGTLVVYSSGEEAAHQRAEPVLAALSKAVYHLGQFGNGSRMKYVANLLVVVNTLAAAEGHALAEASGLDPSVVQEVIAAGVGSSAMFEIRGPMMVDGGYEPPSARLDILRKDATIIAEHAREVGVATPLLDVTLPLYVEASDAGLGALDAAAVRLFLDRLAGR